MEIRNHVFKHSDKVTGKTRRLLRAVELERAMDRVVDQDEKTHPCKCTEEYNVVLKSLEPLIAICTNCNGIL